MSTNSSMKQFIFFFWRGRGLGGRRGEIAVTSTIVKASFTYTFYLFILGEWVGEGREISPWDFTSRSFKFELTNVKALVMYICRV